MQDQGLPQENTRALQDALQKRRIAAATLSNAEQSQQANAANQAKAKKKAAFRTAAAMIGIPTVSLLGGLWGALS